MSQITTTNFRSKRRLATFALAASLLVVPATALGGKTLIDKDSSKGQFAVAVATGDVVNPVKLIVVITAEPRDALVEWSYTNRCIKNNELHSYPGPGDHKILTDKARIKETVRMPVQDPETCDVAVSGKLASKSGKRISVKILSQEP